MIIYYDKLKTFNLIINNNSCRQLGFCKEVMLYINLNALLKIVSPKTKVYTLI